jgi:hypothetical protein
MTATSAKVRKSAHQEIYAKRQHFAVEVHRKSLSGVPKSIKSSWNCSVTATSAKVRKSAQRVIYAKIQHFAAEMCTKGDTRSSLYRQSAVELHYDCYIQKKSGNPPNARSTLYCSIPLLKCIEMRPKVSKYAFQCDCTV